LFFLTYPVTLITAAKRKRLVLPDAARQKMGKKLKKPSFFCVTTPMHDGKASVEKAFDGSLFYQRLF
jgi:hypothetical protein